MKGEEILTHATAWMKMEATLPSKAQRAILYESSLQESPRVIRFLEATGRRVVVRSWERGSGDLLFNGYRILVLQDEGFWSPDSILLNHVVKNSVDGNFMFCVFYLD